MTIQGIGRLGVHCCIHDPIRCCHSLHARWLLLFVVGAGAFANCTFAYKSLSTSQQLLLCGKVFRRLAPWVQENPLQLHLSNADPLVFDAAIEQISKVGFEALVLSFGSGFNFELSPDDPRVASLAGRVAKASALGIEVGGYDLTVLDRGHGGYGGNVGDQWDRVDEAGNLTADACYASGWRDKLEAMLYGVTAKANLSLILTDGPYGGGSYSDVCVDAANADAWSLLAVLAQPING